MDQGLFTFADVKHGVWPAVIILNPKPLITVQRSKEPFHLVVNSSHIRLLVYSPFEIELCQVFTQTFSLKIEFHFCLILRYASMMARGNRAGLQAKKVLFSQRLGAHRSMQMVCTLLK